MERGDVAGANQSAAEAGKWIKWSVITEIHVGGHRRLLLVVVVVTLAASSSSTNGM